ncbi:MAG: tetratricopeptide repeat protein, partial [Micromonosporaceae bacterium]
RGLDPRQHDRAELTELMIVASGARRDLGQNEAAAAMLQVPALRTGPAQLWVARLRYTYADTLLAMGRADEARDWFERALEADPESETGAAEKLLELDGVVLEELEDPEDADVPEGAEHARPTAEQDH